MTSTTSDTGNFPQAIPGVDLETGLNYCMRDQWIYFNYLQTFMNKYSQARQLFEQVYQERTDLKRLLHTIKGSSAQMGANTIRQRAAELEIMVMDEGVSIESMIPALELFARDVEELSLSIRNALPDTLEIKESLSFMEALNELEEMLKNDDAKVRQFLTDHAQVIQSVLGNEKFDRVKAAIDAFDFETALALL